MSDKERGSLLKVLRRELRRSYTGALEIVDVVGTPAGAVPDRPQWLVCDCCLAHMDRLWFWPHRGFCLLPKVRGGQELMAGHWAFCVYCEALWEQRDIPALLARTLTLNPELQGRLLENTYFSLPYAIYGEPIPWESGQPTIKSPTTASPTDAR